MPQPILDRGSVPAATLGAIAESAVWFVPLRSVAAGSIGITVGPMISYPLFVLFFAIAAGAATAFHRSSLLPSVVIAVGLVLGAGQASLSGGHVGPIGVIASVVLMLLVTIRVLTMSLRDWRNPVAEAFGIGATFLLIELAITAQSHSVDRTLVSVLVVQFFLFSMASRAASVRLATPTGHVHGAGRRLRAAGVAVAALGSFLVVGMALGGKHGALQGLGRITLGIIGPILSFIAQLVARLLIGPLSWVFGKLNIDLEPLQDALGSLSGRDLPQGQGGNSWLLRVIGLGVLLLIGWLLIRVIRRLWAPEEGLAEVAEPEIPAASVPLPRRRRRGSRARLEMPADTVRRWYAEALLLLDRRGLRRVPSSTPAEYLLEVRRAFPECGPGFTALTRSYEEVRYGSRTFPKDALDRLEAHRVHLMGSLERARRLDDRDQA